MARLPCFRRLACRFLLLLVEVEILVEAAELLVEIPVEAANIMTPAVPVALAGAVPIAVHEGVRSQHVRKPDKTAILFVVEALV